MILEYINPKFEILLDKLDKKARLIINEKLLKINKHKTRGYAEFYNIFSEVSGYCYLLDEYKSHKINFIPESKKQTPDIEVVDFNGSIICLLESKNIGFSNDQRSSFLVTKTSDRIPSEDILEEDRLKLLKDKINSQIEKAKAQINCYLNSHKHISSVEKIVYLTLQLDLDLFAIQLYIKILKLKKEIQNNQKEFKVVFSSLTT